MSDYLDPQNEELLKDFFDEAQLQIDLFEQNILALEQDPSNPDAVDEIFRAAHTLKGAAATVQMTELTSLTHTVEDVLDDVRSGAAKMDESVVEVLLQSIDTIKAMLGARAEGAVFDEGVPELQSRLSDLTGGKPSAEASTPERAKPAKQPSRAKPVSPTQKPAAAGARRKPATTAPAKGNALSEYELLELQQSVGAGETAYEVIVQFDEDNPMNSVGGIQAFAALKEIGTIVRTVPDFDSLYEDLFFPEVRYYITSSADDVAIHQAVTISDVTLDISVSPVDLLAIEAGETGATESSTATEAEVEDADGGSETPETEIGESGEQADSVGAGDSPAQRRSPPTKVSSGSILRVDSRRIDNLLNLVSEAVINKASFNQLIQTFTGSIEELGGIIDGLQERLKELVDAVPDLILDVQEGKATSAIRTEIADRYGPLSEPLKIFENDYKSAINQFRNNAQSLGRITGELQEGVMQIRMVPISQIFSRFPRLVRDVSKQLGKQVDLVVEGEETELDKSVIEDLLDPLIHCVRNAVDHGVEMPDERANAGKNPGGTVTLSASGEGNMIIIEISDDGKGIGVATVRQRAVEKEIIHPSKELSDVEAFNLIFEPGFSTAKTVTDISGRGVGLDVVKKQIEKLNGTVAVWSEPGEGTKITIKLPLTLAIIQGLLVRVGAEIYALPITSVLESHRIKPTEIRLIDNYEVFNVREDVVSLLRIDRLFGIGKREDQEHYFVVIVGSEEKKVGLIVDALLGEEDVVIKPLRDRYTNSPGIAGATILGDGTVALIIDVSQLLDLGMRQEHLNAQRRAGAQV